MKEEIYEYLEPNSVNVFSIFIIIKLFIFPYGNIYSSIVATILIFILFLLTSYRKFQINTKNINLILNAKNKEKEKIIQYYNNKKISFKLLNNNLPNNKHKKVFIHYNILYVIYISIVVFIILEPTILYINYSSY